MTHWDSFLTLYYFDNIVYIISQIDIIFAMGKLNKVMWHFLCLFPMLKLTSIIFPSYHYHMKPTSATQHSTVISLLKEEYSVCQIVSKTGLGRSTVGRIKKKTDLDKEDSKGGCNPQGSRGRSPQQAQSPCRRHGFLDCIFMCDLIRFLYYVSIE